MVIRRSDRVLDLIRRDGALIEVLAGLSPALERLRSPEMRKVMSSLLTVEQVAQMAGVDPDHLVARLNGEADETEDDEQPSQKNVSGATTESGWPAELRTIPETKVVRLDVREDLRAGREPFSQIMAARREVPEGGALCIRAIFEPVPLYAVMERQGLAHHTEYLAEDDWQVWFYPAATSPAAAPSEPISHSTAVEEGTPDESGEGDVVVLDVRGLEPPEPMVRTLEALEALPDGQTLVQLNVRVPQFLLPQLEERGFVYEIREQSPELVRVFIHRAS